MGFIRADVNQWAYEGLEVSGGILVAGMVGGRAGFFIEEPKAPPVATKPPRPIEAPSPVLPRTFSPLVVTGGTTAVREALGAEPDTSGQVAVNFIPPQEVVNVPVESIPESISTPTIGILERPDLVERPGGSEGSDGSLSVPQVPTSTVSGGMQSGMVPPSGPGPTITDAGSVPTIPETPRDVEGVHYVPGGLGPFPVVPAPPAILGPLPVVPAPPAGPEIPEVPIGILEQPEAVPVLSAGTGIPTQALPGVPGTGPGLAGVGSALVVPQKGTPLENIELPSRLSFKTEEDPVVAAAGGGDWLTDLSTWGSGAIGMDPNRTISAQAGEAAGRGETWGELVCWALGIVDPDHCQKALAGERYTDPGCPNRWPGDPNIILGGMKCSTLKRVFSLPWWK